MPIPSKRLWICGALLLVLFGGYLTVWYRIDTRPPAWDESTHLGIALSYRDFLVHGKPVTTPWASYYPPFYHVSLIPALSLGIPSEGKALATHVIYLLILFCALLLLGQHFQRPIEDAVLASLLTIGYWQVIFVSHHALLDFALMAWVTLGMALLGSTKHFSNRRLSLLWGAVCGLGLLIKPGYLLFPILPALGVLGGLWFSASSERAKACKNFGLALALALLISLPWYGSGGFRFLQYFFYEISTYGRTHHEPDFLTLAGWWYYIRALWPQMGPLSFLMTLGGLGLAFAYRRRVEGVSFFLLWMLSGYLGVTLVHNKDLRFSLPILPALALLSSMGWTSLARRQFSRWILLGVGMGLFVFNALRVDLPRREDWKHLEIGSTLQQYHDPIQPFILTSVLSNHPLFFGRNIRWSLRAHGISIDLSAPGDPLADFTEFVITKSSDRGAESDHLEEEWHQLQKSGRAFKTLFTPVSHFSLPDGSETTIYQRDAHHVFDVRPVTKPLIEKRLYKALQQQIAGAFTIDLEGTQDEFQKGRAVRARIRGGPWILRDLPIAQAEVVLTKPWFNLYRLWDENQLGLLAFESIKPTVQINAVDVQNLLAKKVKGLEDIHVNFTGGKVQVRARFHGLPLGATARVEIESSPPCLVATVSTLKAAGIPVPGWLFGKIHRQTVPLDPIPSFPGHILIQQVVLENDVLKII